MNDWREEYIQRVKQIAASNPVIMEAMRIWGMTWEEYEQELKNYLYPPVYIYTSANTDGTQLCYECQKFTISEFEVLE